MPGAGAALFGALLSLSAHSRSEGRSSFVLDPEGRIAVQIVLSDLDLPELCNVDFSVRDRAAEEQKLTRCLHKDVPLLVRLTADDKPCKIAFDHFAENKGTITIEASGLCPTFPRTLRIDWGLFAGSPLDHVSVAKIEQPHDAPKLVMLSKRSSRVLVEVKRPRWPWLVATAAASAAVLVGAAALLLHRRRARRAVRAGDPPAPTSDR
jgi:hypothetical protein